VEVRFEDPNLERLETDPTYRGLDLADEVVKSFRRKIQFIRDAVDERDLRAMKSLHFEKLRGNRAHQRSIRLNKQWRLILELETNPSGNVVVVVKIEDYH